MKSATRLALALLLTFALCALASLHNPLAAPPAQSKSAAPAKSAVSAYNSLRPQQRALFEKSFPASTGQKPADRYAALSPSQQTTFDAVTHALLNTNLTAKNGGKPLGNLLPFVLQIEEILGLQKGQRGDKQFRLYAKMNPKIAEVLNESREFFRDKDNSVFHKGYPINFRLAGRVPSIQVSLAPDASRADIDVDYRSSRIPAGLVNGHLSAANSDVRPPKNYRGHLRRWQGLVAWWRDLFGSHPDEPAPALPPDLPGDARADLPENAPIAAISDAVSEFLHDWLVRLNHKSAMHFFSPNAIACTNADEDTEFEIVRGKSARDLFSDVLEEVTRVLGKNPNLASAIEDVHAWDDTYHLVDHSHKHEFTLYSITDHEADEFLCKKIRPLAQHAEPGSAPATVPEGNYYLSVFQFRLADDAGGVLALLWHKENGHWKILAFDTEEH